MKIAHVVPLRAVGGVERSYSEFIAYQTPRFPLEHHTIALGRGIPPVLEPGIREASRSLTLAHYQGGKHIPFEPAALRERYLESLLADLKPDIALFWNKPTGVALERLDPALPVVYWERGRAWKENDEQGAQRFLNGTRAILCNSNAARRFLELRFGLPPHAEVHVCPNAVRPAAIVENPTRAPLPGRLLHLGFAGRLVPVKGACLALHTVAELQRRGVECRLSVAGEGPEGDKLRELTAQLDLGDTVHFAGLVDDMPGFFSAIDCLLCPSLREPFGLVAAEALANGCAVVATAVDGLAEVVAGFDAARSILPSLPLEKYRAFGGDPEDVPPQVYDPADDALAPPRLPDPQHLADAVLELIQPAAEFAFRSQRARAQALSRFDFAAHVDCVLGILERVPTSGEGPYRP